MPLTVTCLKEVSNQLRKDFAMKKSPFALLREAIENELFNTSLHLQELALNDSPVNSEFFLGYNEALKLLLQKADYIYRYGVPPKF